MKTPALNILLGVAIGDAIGVPYEFSEREEMQQNPAKEMIGFKMYNQPPGTWSDDSSLTFCLAESLIEGYDLKSLSSKFIKWRKEAYWTAWNNVFDIGMTTTQAISRLERILISGNLHELKALKESAEEKDNGNGSLMRILPLVFEIYGKSDTEQFKIIWENSALTHRHIRAAMSCFIYLKFALKLLKQMDKQSAYQKTRKEIGEFWNKIDFPPVERKNFARIIQNDLNEEEEKSILSGGYVIESLEASIWCILKSQTFEESVLKAVNFGHDTDTTGAITGGLAGILYTKENMPEFWIASLARMEDIFKLGERLDEKYNAIKNAYVNNQRKTISEK